jgi:hypothetical protein
MVVVVGGRRRCRTSLLKTEMGDGRCYSYRITTEESSAIQTTEESSNEDGRCYSYRIMTEESSAIQTTEESSTLLSRRCSNNRKSEAVVGSRIVVDIDIDLENRDRDRRDFLNRIDVDTALNERRSVAVVIFSLFL